MGTVFVVLSIAVVVGLGAVLAWVFLVEPFADHEEHFRDSHSGQKIGVSPRLD